MTSSNATTWSGPSSSASKAASRVFAAIFTSNLLFIGVVQGMITALIAMGIVLVYRSSRVINFAVGDLGVPATALLAIMVGIHHWPYWIGLVAALAIGALSGTVVELAVIRRLFHAPRVIVLVATIGVAELAQAVSPGPAQLRHRVAADLLPQSHQRPVEHRRRHHGERRPAPGPHRRPGDHASDCGGSSTAPGSGSRSGPRCRTRTWPVSPGSIPRRCPPACGPWPGSCRPWP